MITETNIVRLYIFNDAYRQLMIGKIEKDMFDDSICGDIFELAHSYFIKNRKMQDNIKINIINNPWKHSKEILELMISIVNINKDEYNVNDIGEYLEETEKWWKLQQIKLLLSDGVDIVKGKSKLDTHNIHERAKNIDQFSYSDSDIFNIHNDKKMIDFYCQDSKRIKFCNEYLNQILNGGMVEESLNIIIAGTHVGKTRLLVNLACDFQRKAKDRSILYISMEQPEEHIASYIDMNYMDMSVKDIQALVKADSNKYVELRKKIHEKIGDIIIKRYPSTITTAGIRNYVKKLVDLGRRPDCIFLDYIQLIKPIVPSANMFEVGDSVSKEIRAISQEFQIPIWTAAQIKVIDSRNNTNIDGSADPYSISGSKAYGENADFIMNVIQDKTMKRNNQQIYTFPKNRHGGIHDYVLFGEVIRETYKINFTGIKNLSEVDNQELESESEKEIEVESKFSFDPKVSF